MSYGTTLKFSLLQDSKMSRQFGSDDIIFKNGNDQIIYTHDPTKYRGKEWTHYNIKINADHGWFKGGYKSNDIKAILSNITQFSIRGEFETGPDTGALDNVIISRK